MSAAVILRLESPGRCDSRVEPADKEDARSIMLALTRAHEKLDDILYILGEDDEEEEENETDS